MAVDAKLVSELREMTGAGIMDAKKALEETGGDLEKAADELRKRGVAKAAKKAGRETNEGRVHGYVHATGKLGAMVEVLCETDFVARNEAFIEMCNDIALHVSAEAPLYLTREEVPQDVIDKEKEMLKEEMAGENKPEDVMEKIMEGKMNKWFADVVLMEQKFVKDEDQTMEDFVKEKIATLGENIQIRGFKRFQIG